MTHLLFPKRKVLVSIAVFIASICQSIKCQANDDEKNCEPSLADTCFNRVTRDIQCLVTQGKTRDCISADICSSVDDALQCTSDIIDTDCGRKEGRDTFDAWLKGLRAVYYYLCGRERTGLLGITQNPECWNPMSFLKCTEKMAGIGHVNDLLKQKLDMNECNRLLIGMSVCNSRATNILNPRCAPSLESVSEIIHTFFSKTECGRLCSGRNSSQRIMESLISIWSASMAALFFSLILHY